VAREAEEAVIEYVTWMVETGLDPEAEERLLDSLAILPNVEVQVRKLVPFGEGLQPGPGTEPEGPIVFHGSLQGAKWVQENTDWRPGAIANNPRLRCSSYYPVFGEHLLNRRHLFLPFGCMEAMKDDLFEWLGEADCIFVRPDANDKPFTGQLVRREKWDEDMQLIGFYKERVRPDTMCVVAAPQNVGKEWRFFVKGREVLTGSVYRKGPYTPVREVVDMDTAPWPWILAEELANHAVNGGYQPDPIWVLDLCMDADDQLRLLEVGSFSCAGIYDCDTDVIARAVTEIARGGR